MSRIYSHPEGASISLYDTTLTVAAENGQTASVQIGPVGCCDVAKKLLAHAADFERAVYLQTHDSHSKTFDMDSAGLCPICSNDPDILNVGREHYAVCHEHKVFWHVGSNLYSGWRDESAEIWDTNKRLLATYTDSNDRRKIGTDSQIDNTAMQDEVARMFSECRKPTVKISTVEKRPTIGTLGDVLKATAMSQPMGYTRISGYSESRWNGLQPGEKELLELSIEGVTACLEPTNAVTIFIAEGTAPATARALLKAAAKEVKDYGNFERFTPLAPASDEPAPF